MDRMIVFGVFFGQFAGDFDFKIGGDYFHLWRIEITSKPKHPANDESIIALGESPWLVPPFSTAVSIKTRCPRGLSDSNSKSFFQYVVTTMIHNPNFLQRYGLFTKIF